MNIFDLWHMIITLLADHTMRLVLFSSALTGMTSGILGVFAFLRGQSLLADAISHAALPGIAGAFLITHSTNPAVLLCGGGIAGIIGAWLITLITTQTTLKKDAALGIVLSVFFGLGMVLITIIQKNQIAHHGILNKFLFGSVAIVLQEDVMVIGMLSIVALSGIWLLWKEFTIITFDVLYAQTLGYSINRLDLALTFLLVIAIMIGLQTMGVLLMSALFVAPAAAARQWTNSLGHMVILAGSFGSGAAIGGTLLSKWYCLPTGPAIIVVVSCIVLFSICCAPLHGFLWRYWSKNNKSKLFHQIIRFL